VGGQRDKRPWKLRLVKTKQIGFARIVRGIELGTENKDLGEMVFKKKA